MTTSFIISTELGPLNLSLIALKDNEAVARLIRTVMPEFGASGPGFAIGDPEVDDMFGAYQMKEGETIPRARYYVIKRDQTILGAGGFAPLAGAEDSICEVRKMYFYQEARGLGAGAVLLLHILKEARAAGYENAYLETLTSMTAARKLYQKCGFTPLTQPLGQTGHGGCDYWCIKDIA